MAKRSKNIKFRAGLGSFNGDTFQRVIKNENAYTKIRVDDVDPSWSVRNAKLKSGRNYMLVKDCTHNYDIWFLGTVRVKSISPFLIECDGRNFVFYY